MYPATRLATSCAQGTARGELERLAVTSALGLGAATTPLFYLSPPPTQSLDNPHSPTQPAPPLESQYWGGGYLSNTHHPLDFSCSADHSCIARMHIMLGEIAIALSECMIRMVSFGQNASECGLPFLSIRSEWIRMQSFGHQNAGTHSEPFWSIRKAIRVHSDPILLFRVPDHQENFWLEMPQDKGKCHR